MFCLLSHSRILQISMQDLCLKGIALDCVGTPFGGGVMGSIRHLEGWGNDDVTLYWSGEREAEQDMNL